MARKRQLKVDISGDPNNTGRQAIAGIGDEADRAGGKFTSMARVGGQALATLGTAAVAFGAASVHQAIGFGDSMREVFTLMPGISQQAMDDMSQQVKDFSVDFGVLPNDVVPALYDSISAGLPPDNVFEFLETAQMAAKGGVTELGTAVDGISSVVNAYGSDVLSAAEASDLMFTAVRLGKTNFEELSGSLFNVAPAAASLGVGFGDVTAALATLTAQGVPTSVATTQLRAAFVELGKEGTAAAEAFDRAAGTSFPDFIAAGGSTAEAVALMASGADDAGTSLSNLFGSVEAGQAFQALNADLDGFVSATGDMNDSAGATQAAFELMDRGASASWDRITARVNVAMITIGEKLMPVVESAMDFFAEHVIPIIENVVTVFSEDGLAGVIDLVRGKGEELLDWIKDLADKSPIVAGAVGGVLVAAFGALAVSAGAAAASMIAAVAPFVAVAAVAAGLGAGFVWLYQNVETFREVVDAVAQWIRNDFVPTMQSIGDVVADVASAVVEFVENNWRPVWETVAEIVEIVVGKVFDIVEPIVQSLIDTAQLIKAVFTGDWDRAFSELTSLVGNVIEGIVAFFREVPGTIATAIIEHGPGMLTNIGNWFVFTVMPAFGNAALGIGSAIVRGVVNALASLGDALVDLFVGAWEAVLGWFRDLSPIDFTEKIVDVLPNPLGALGLGGTELDPEKLRAEQNHAGGVFTTRHGGPGLAILDHGERITSKAGSRHAGDVLVIELHQDGEMTTRQVERVSERRRVRINVA